MADTSRPLVARRLRPRRRRVRRPAPAWRESPRRRRRRCASRPSTSRSPPSSTATPTSGSGPGCRSSGIPDDVMVLQELFWSYRPERVVETGVARGGSMLLNASLMRMCGLEPAVLGIDHKLFPHTTSALAEHPLGEGVELLEADSTSRRRGRGDARASSTAPSGSSSSSTATTPTTTCSASCEALAPLLPSGGMVLVADTLVEEFPDGPLRGPSLGPRRQPDDGRPRLPRRRTTTSCRADDVGPPRAGHRVPRRDPAPSLIRDRAGREPRTHSPGRARHAQRREHAHQRAPPSRATAGRPGSTQHEHERRRSPRPTPRRCGAQRPSAPSAACWTTPTNMPLLAAASTARLATPRVKSGPRADREQPAGPSSAKATTYATPSTAVSTSARASRWRNVRLVAALDGLGQVREQRAQHGRDELGRDPAERHRAGERPQDVGADGRPSPAATAPSRCWPAADRRSRPAAGASGRSGTSAACSRGRASHGPMRQLPASRLSTTDAQHPSASVVTESWPVAASTPTNAPRATPSVDSCVGDRDHVVATGRGAALQRLHRGQRHEHREQQPPVRPSPLNSRSARTGAQRRRRRPPARRP